MADAIEVTYAVDAAMRDELARLRAELAAYHPLLQQVAAALEAAAPAVLKNAGDKDGQRILDQAIAALAAVRAALGEKGE